MIIGVLLGPSVIGLLSEDFQSDLSFITEIALGFVAISIGLELSLKSLKKQGLSILLIILFESLFACVVVAIGIYLLTGNLPMALVFGALATASAPAGTVAVIQEYQASGSLTRALYSVVGFDDGLGIIIYGFASAIAKSLIIGETGGEVGSFLALMKIPLLEVALSIVIGSIIAIGFCSLLRRLNNPRDIYVVIFGMVLFLTGISLKFHLSYILTNMIAGMVIVNTQSSTLIQKIRGELNSSMPLLFILFFVLAGAQLHIEKLPSLGIIGIVYIVCRSIGKISGAFSGAVLGRAESKLKKFVGIGILSQAGVAIGLALITSHEFARFGETGMKLGSAVITTITATSVVFEIIGPVFARIALSRAGEIKQ